MPEAAAAGPKSLVRPAVEVLEYTPGNTEGVGVEQMPSARIWAAIAECARRDGVAVSARCAVTACADRLAAAGAGLSMTRDGEPREPVLASAPTAEDLEELQFTLGQGPCVDAVVGRGPVLVADLARADAQCRWPLFAPAAAERGVRGMFSFPVAIGAALVGVLDVYRLQAGPLTQRELADGLVFADAVLMLVLGEQGGAVPGDGLADAVTGVRHAQVHQATGMVAAQLGVGMADALAVLRGRAYARGLRLSDLAADILARKQRFGPGETEPHDHPRTGESPAGDASDDQDRPPEPGRRGGREGE